MLAGVAEVVGISVTEGEEADRLIKCLKDKADPLDVVVDRYVPTKIDVHDPPQSVGDLRTFLVRELDQCGREHAIDWRAHLRILPPP
jgi:hypothetical protein